MVGPASISPRPPGAGRAPWSAMACCTRTPSARFRSLPNQSLGQVGTAHPEVPRRSHHSATVRSGSQLSASQSLASATTSPLVVVRSAVSVMEAPRARDGIVGSAPGTTR
jgi:hypothetical protein